MSEWKEHKINDIVVDYLDFRGKTPRKLGMDWGNGNIKALSANNVGKGKIDFNKECYLGSEELYKIWMNKGDCHKGDVLITMEAPLGNVAQIPDDKKYILSQRTLLFKTQKEIVNNDFFFYVLSDREFQDELQKNSTGSTVTGIQQKKLARLKVKLPALATQAKIAKILTTCDTVIEQTQAAIAKYKSIKQGMLHDLFTRGLNASGKLRPTFQQAPELYKESELGMIPKEWEVKIIMGLTDGSNYSIVDGPFGSNLKTIHYKSQGIPIIQSGFVTKNYFKADSYLYVDNDKFQSEIRSKVVAGDIIMAKIGAQCGTCALLPENHPVGIIAGNCLKITISKEYSNTFYERYFHYMYTIGTISKIILTTAQPAVSMSSLKKLKVIFPQPNEQKNISKKMLSIDRKLQSEETLLSKYQSIKRGLMGDLLSGKKEV